MSRTSVNFLLDAFLLLVFMCLAATSVVVRFVFPPGTQADRWSLWGHGYDAWVGLQFNLLALLALGILFHLMLHWSWVCGVAANRLSKWLRRTIRIDEASQTVYGVGLLVVLFTLIGLVVAAASLQIRSDATGIATASAPHRLGTSTVRRQPLLANAQPHRTTANDGRDPTFVQSSRTSEVGALCSLRRKIADAHFPSTMFDRYSEVKSDALSRVPTVTARCL